MTDKQFNAIIAKNHIARELGDYMRDTNNEISVPFVLSCLRDIEAYTGEGNQPNIDDIINETKYRL